MKSLSKHVKEELINALDDENSAIFIVDGKLFSLEVHDSSSSHDNPLNLTEEIEEYMELKKSLQRFLDNPEMKRYTVRELKEARHAKRK